MRLQRIEVENFRGFESAAFQFHPQFNLVIGENGAGKTSLLEAAAVAVGSWLLGFRGYDSRHIRTQDIRRIFQTVEGRYRELPQFPVRVRAWGEIIVKGESPASETSIDLCWARSLRGIGGRTTQGEASSLQQVAAKLAGSVLSGDAVLLPVVRYFGAGRLWEPVRERPKRRSPLATTYRGQKLPDDDKDVKEMSAPFYGYQMSVDKRCSPSDLMHWMRAERRFEVDEDRVSVPLRMVFKAIQELLPEVDNVQFNLRQNTLIIKQKSGDDSQFSDLSDGYRNVVAIAADLAIKASMLNPHLGEAALADSPGVVIIDELDLHLHPKWQRRVIEDLRRVFPKLQFICSTHSPFLVQSLRSGEELVILDGRDPMAQVANLGLEDVSEALMGVESAETSRRYSEMHRTAFEYLEELDRAALAPREKLQEFEERLSQKLDLYADDPAFQAFLEFQRAAKLGVR